MDVKQTQHTLEEIELKNVPLLLQFMDEAIAALAQPARGSVRYRLDFFNAKEQRMNCSYDAYALQILWSIYKRALGIDDGQFPYQREAVKRLLEKNSVHVDIPIGAGK